MLPLHSITEWFRLEGVSGGHPVQLPCSGRATWRRPMKPGPCPNGFWRSTTTCIPGAYVCQKTSLSSILKLLRLTCQGHSCSPFWERVPSLSVWTAQETKRWSPPGLYEIFPQPLCFLEHGRVHRKADLHRTGLQLVSPSWGKERCQPVMLYSTFIWVGLKTRVRGIHLDFCWATKTTQGKK